MKERFCEEVRCTRHEMPGRLFRVGKLFRVTDELEQHCSVS